MTDFVCENWKPNDCKYGEEQTKLCVDSNECLDDKIEKRACPLSVSCYNGEEDSNEEGIDCGGDCDETCQETPEKRSWIIWIIIVIGVIAAAGFILFWLYRIEKNKPPVSLFGLNEPPNL